MNPTSSNTVKDDTENQKSTIQHLKKSIENYFCLGNRSLSSISDKLLGGEHELKVRYEREPVLLSALKIISYMTVIIPLLVLLTKKVLEGAHKSHTFQIMPISPSFTQNRSIAEQRKAHEVAKTYLQEKAVELKAEVTFTAPITIHPIPKVNSVILRKNLDMSVFSWEDTQGIQGDIQRDGKNPDNVVLYGVASQFNSCEAIDRFTPNPGTAVKTYQGDPTQGPGAQLQFPDQQVEIINNAANLGFNGLCQVLDDTDKSAVKHGYLTPETADSAKSVIKQLQKNGSKLEYLCIGNIPKGANNTEKVYEMLVAAPAFGHYSRGSATDNQKSEIEFLCALQGYRAQFQQVIQLASASARKQLIFKPTAPGLGVFGNKVKNVSTACYVSAKEYETRLKRKKIQVRLQVFQSKGEARDMATSLGLHKYSIEKSESFAMQFLKSVSNFK